MFEKANSPAWHSKKLHTLTSHRNWYEFKPKKIFFGHTLGMLKFLGQSLTTTPPGNYKKKKKNYKYVYRALVIMATNQKQPKCLSIRAWINCGTVTKNYYTHKNNILYIQQHGQISETSHRVKGVRYKKIHTVWFHLHEIQNWQN